MQTGANIFISYNMRAYPCTLKHIRTCKHVGGQVASRRLWRKRKANGCRADVIKRCVGRSPSSFVQIGFDC
eukprot:5270937-Pyramimonas_sp.AAC.1